MAGDPFWDDVVLLTYLDGADGATTAADESQSGHAITFKGGQLDTTIKKFGTASFEMLARGNNLELADHADWAFGGGDFTIECHVYWTAAQLPGTAQHVIVSQDGGTNDRGFNFRMNNGNLSFRYSQDGGWPSGGDVTAAFTPTADTWHHVAAERAGNTFRLYVDGAVVATADWTGVSLHDSTGLLEIGNDTNSSSSGMEGYIDEVRITRAARYDGAFTPPTEQYPNFPPPPPPGAGGFPVVNVIQ